MATKLESLSTKLQSALDLANSLPDAITLDELTNPGSSATMLAGTEMLDAEGKKVTGSIESKDSSDLTASGATVNVPAGYYAEDASKKVSSGSVNQPTITVDDSGNVKATVSYSSGYISSGSTYGTKALGTGSVTVSGRNVKATAGYYPSDVTKTVSLGSVPTPTITVDDDGLITAKTSVSGGYVYVGTKTGTKQLDTQEATTITPTKSSQTAVAAGKYTTGAVTVGAIPDKYQDVSGVTATAARTAAGDKFVDKNGVAQTGILAMDKVLLRSSRVDEEMGMNIMHEMAAAHAGNTLATSWDQFGSALASQVLEGNTFTSGGTNGSKTSSDIHYSYEPVFCGVGTMPNNGTLSSTIDGLETKSVSIPKGYTDGGTVALDTTIDDTADAQAEQIEEIKALLSGKSVSGGSAGSGDSVETCTVNISADTCPILFVSWVSLVDGEQVIQCDEPIESSYSISNVVCNTPITIYDETGTGVYLWSFDGDATEVGSFIDGGTVHVSTFYCGSPGTVNATRYAKGSFPT